MIPVATEFNSNGRPFFNGLSSSICYFHPENHTGCTFERQHILKLLIDRICGSLKLVRMNSLLIRIMHKSTVMWSSCRSLRQLSSCSFVVTERYLTLQYTSFLDAPLPHIKWKEIHSAESGIRLKKFKKFSPLRNASVKRDVEKDSTARWQHVNNPLETCARPLKRLRVPCKH